MGALSRPILVLASGSPRRKRLLAEQGIAFEVVAPGADGPGVAEEPAERVLEHARFKAQSVAERLPGRWVLAADTLVHCAGRFLPKPAGRDEAREMLGLLSGATHEVWTGVVLRGPDGSSWETAERAVVRFREIPGAELQAYLEGREWADKAGAYGYQGTAGRWAVLEEGDAETVIGLPTRAVRALLAQGGVGPELASS